MLKLKSPPQRQMCIKKRNYRDKDACLLLPLPLTRPNPRVVRVVFFFCALKNFSFSFFFFLLCLCLCLCLRRRISSCCIYPRPTQPSLSTFGPEMSSVPCGGTSKKAIARTSMDFLGGALGGVSGSSMAVWKTKRGPSSFLS